MKSKWIASLSNGESISESKINEIDQSLSYSDRQGWLRLVDYCRHHNTHITHLKAIVNGVEYNLPTFGESGRFPNQANVSSFWAAKTHVRVMGLMGGGSSETYMNLSYSDGHFRHHLIINEKTNGCWISTSKLDEGLSKSISDIVGEW